MTNSKMTRRALLTSVMALVLCFAMLTGTTFAWFTDQETSGNNRIVAGNLDVDLLMYNGTEYVSIANGNGDIFKEGTTANNSNATLWEPGKTQIAYLAIENKGNLDLKYKVELNVKDPDNGKLYEVMTYTITPDAKNGDLPAWDDAKALGVKVGKQDVSEEVKLGNGATHYFALSIHMDEEANNDYMKDYLIFDLTVYATQVDSEADAFDNQYDADAFFELSKDESGAYLLGSATDLLAFNAAANEEGFMGGEGRTVDIKLTADIDLAGKTWTPIEDMWIVFDGNGHTIKNLTTESARRAGLFGYAGGVTIKNLTIENANVTGSQAGIFAGSGEGLTIENCFIKGQNTVTYIKTEESAGGIGVVTGVSVNNNMNVEIVNGATVSIDGSTMQTVLSEADYYVGYKVAGYATNSGTITDNGTVNVLKYVSEGVARDNLGVYYVSNATGFAYFNAKALTGNNGTAETATINITEDLNMNNADFSAIIAQRGDKLVIVGNGHKISNANIISGANDNTTGQASMFYTYPDSTLEISNLTLENITVTAEKNDTGYAAVVAGYCEGTAVLTNVDVVNATVTGYKSSGSLVGHLSGSVTANGCEVSGTTVTLGDYVACGHYAGKVIGTLAGAANLTGCTFDVTVSGNLNTANNGDVYGRSTDAGSLTVN